MCKQDTSHKRCTVLSRHKEDWISRPGRFEVDGSEMCRLYRCWQGNVWSDGRLSVWLRWRETVQVFHRNPSDWYVHRFHSRTGLPTLASVWIIHNSHHNLLPVANKPIGHWVCYTFHLKRSWSSTNDLLFISKVVKYIIFICSSWRVSQLIMQTKELS